MATYLWSTLVDREVIDGFDRESDVLRFDDSHVSESDVVPSWSSDTSVTYAYGGRSVTLQLVGPSEIAPALAFGDAAAEVDWGKLHGGLAELYRASLAAPESAIAGAAAAEGELTQAAVPATGDGKVVIDAVAADGNGAALLRALVGLGLEYGASFGALASGLLPIAKLDDIAQLAVLKFVQPAYASTAAGLVSDQADLSMHTGELREVSGLDGTHFKVGILSDSFNYLATLPGRIDYADDIASGDLPAGVTILQDFGSPAQPGTDEGRAMAQLVHDVAPGAGLAFHTAFLGQANFAQGILDLSGTSDVIVDDVSYFAEPYFQDGVIAQAVDQAVASGDAYFSSAGNAAARSYEAPFRNSGVSVTAGGKTYILHDFDPGGGVDTLQRATQNGTNVVYTLQWDQPFFSVSPGSGGATSDLAFLVYSATTGNFLFGFDANNIGADPVEVGAIGGNAPFDIAIGIRAGADPGLIKYTVSQNGSFTANEFATNSATSYGHANAAGAVSVAAAGFFNTPAFGVNPPVAETFTSLGGVPILFDTNGVRLATPVMRDKVDLTAVDGTNTTFFSADSTADADSFPNFFGTSAAAPHAAAMAALMRQYAPTATPAQIEQAMKDGAIDMTSTVGWDPLTGFGLIQARAALKALDPLVNDAPQDTVPDAQSVVEGNTLTFSTANGNAIVAFDVDADPLTDALRVTLSVGQGTLTLSTVAGLSFTTGDGTADTAMTFTGLEGSINAALNGLVYAPGLNFAGLDTLTFTVNDQGASGTDPGLTGDAGSEEDQDTVDITVTSVNDAPENTVPAPQTITEDTALVFSASNGNAISVGDVDDADNLTSGDETLQITLSASTGVLTLNGTVGIGFVAGGNGSGSMTFTGTLADINTALDGLTFAPSANFNGTASVSITTDDVGNFGVGGALSDADTIDVTVTAVPDLFLWSVLTDAQVISNFHPGEDVLRFDSASIAAAAVTVTAGSSILAFGGKTVTLETDLASLTTSAVTFDDGSVLVVGDNQAAVVNDDAANTITGGSGGDQLLGLGGNDYLQARAGDDTLQGGDGNDQLEGGTGGDHLAGGAGFDYAKYTFAGGAVTVDLADSLQNAGEASGDSYDGIEGAIGSAFGDHLLGDGNVNDLAGLAGADAIFGRGGNDNLQGGAGDDRLEGGAGGDRLVGGDGFDYVVYENAAGGIVINLSSAYQNTGEAAGDGYLTVEGVIGTSGGDTIVGNDGANDLQGLGGNDYIQARGGDDTLQGGDGADQLEGGAGADTLLGGAGFDYARYTYAGSAVIADLNGTELAAGDAIGDTYGSIEGLIGSALADSLYGDDTVNDLAGLNGDDMLFGRGGNDNLQGMNGDDTLQGGTGADRLVGDGGNDTFVFSFGEANGDVVVDFDGQGGAPGDTLRFENYGPGATFTNVDATHWQVNLVGGLVHEVITFQNAAAIDASDFTFV